MARRNENEPEVVTMAEGNDAVTVRDSEHPDADKVRNGELSAAQLAGGSGNVDPDNPDAQYPPGIVQNSVQRDVNPDYPDPATFVPARNTSAAPDYGTNAEE